MNISMPTLPNCTDYNACNDTIHVLTHCSTLTQTPAACVASFSAIIQNAGIAAVPIAIFGPRAMNVNRAVLGILGIGTSIVAYCVNKVSHLVMEYTALSNDPTMLDQLELEIVKNRAFHNCMQEAISCISKAPFDDKKCNLLIEKCQKLA